jgi:hypothetical protein
MDNNKDTNAETASQDDLRQKVSLFRKTAIDHMNSPDDLNNYIKVTTPATWIVLSAVILLLVSLLVWGIFGSVTVNTVNPDGTFSKESVTPIEYVVG